MSAVVMVSAVSIFTTASRCSGLSVTIAVTASHHHWTDR